MKFVIQLILVVVLSWIGQFIGPWWVLFIAAGLSSMVVKSSGITSFFAGFFGVAIQWFFQTLFIDMANESILSTRIAQLFSLNSSFLLMLITALIGGFCGGFGALTGNQLVRIFERPKQKHSVYS